MKKKLTFTVMLLCTLTVFTGCKRSPNPIDKVVNAVDGFADAFVDTIDEAVDALKTTAVMTVAQNPTESKNHQTTTAKSNVEKDLEEPTTVSSEGMLTPKDLRVGDFVMSGKVGDKPFKAFALTYVFNDFEITEYVGVFEDGSGFADAGIPEVVLKTGFTEEEFLGFCKSVPAYVDVELSPESTENKYSMFGTSANLYETIITTTESPESARQFALLLAEAYQMQQGFDLLR